MKDGPGNGRRTKTIEIDVADAPMLAGAMRLASATALMYGAEQENARLRFQRYRDVFLELSPPEAALFRDEEAWAEIAVAMDAAPSFRVDWKEGSWPHRDRGTATVAVGTRVWTTNAAPATREDAERLAKALEEIAPLSCVRADPTPEDPA